jgi:hypothetical protein
MIPDRHRALLDIFVDAVCDSRGDLEPRLRRDLVEGKPLTGALGAFAIKVRDNPTTIDEQQITALRKAGYTEDAIFECVLAAAIGAGLERLHKGLALLEKAESNE